MTVHEHYQCAEKAKKLHYGTYDEVLGIASKVCIIKPMIKKRKKASDDSFAVIASEYQKVVDLVKQEKDCFEI